MPKTINEKLAEGRQYRNMSVMECRSVEEGQDESYIVEGYATTFNEPYDMGHNDWLSFREQIDPNAFSECDMSDVIMQYDHRGRVFARTSNKTLTLSVDDHGLKIRADLGGTEAGRQLYDEIRGGYTTKMSFGFHVLEVQEVRTENTEAGTVDYLDTITKIDKLYDVSAVSLPANDGTTITDSRSHFDGLIKVEEEERLRRERVKNLTEECLRLLAVNN